MVVVLPASMWAAIPMFLVYFRSLAILVLAMIDLMYCYKRIKNEMGKMPCWLQPFCVCLFLLTVAPSPLLAAIVQQPVFLPLICRYALWKISPTTLFQWIPCASTVSVGIWKLAPPIRLLTSTRGNGVAQRALRQMSCGLSPSFVWILSMAS